MSWERIFKALVSLGLSEIDARVYIHLATKGPALARDIMKELMVKNRQVYRSLRKLQDKGTVRTNNEHPARFSALPFEEVVDMLIELKEGQAKTLQESREELISSWQTNKREKQRITESAKI